VTSALVLYRRHTKSALLDLMQKLDQDPESKMPPGAGGIHLLTPKARRLSTALAQAIAWHMEDERNAAGRPIPTCGYSGRQSNRS